MRSIPAVSLCAVLALAMTGSALAQYGTQNSTSSGISAPMGKTSSMPATGTNGVLVDQNGMTLYTFTKGVDCTGKCAIAWPPLLAPSDAKASGKFTIVTRSDGTKQWAYNGQALYLFIKDKKVGQELGNDITHFGGTWHVAKAGT